jgi:predicted metalloprotease with PDZ domain
VLAVEAHSPASNAGLVSFFDVIISVNDVYLGSETLESFLNIVKDNVERKVRMEVYNCKNNTLRQLYIIPSQRWPGKGYFGALVRFDECVDITENICRIVNVEKNSPAEDAGLVSHDDYILGTRSIIFLNDDMLSNELQIRANESLHLYAYNVASDEVRIITVVPNQNWGGEGLLGVEIGIGLLHSLPRKNCLTTGKEAGRQKC